ncbi:YebC/PmpR family DNA-binding transcriptional regulator [Candidatus Uhrbacteria bacterium]|jgi:YebC/PmpR family DNA-binding regulatory protein|nr:YebC/PmpR family DNA-binding transcriptional regulator [Candidatus Uhrbacteria bacterium]MBT7717603.1 YebC/PmpR family DNA-binding transcriptional regulator [Candidatus Uhrbacteria bacterium]
MSGHSKWASIRHKKGAADAKRGKAFSKLAKLISVAARDGSDPAMNFSLRLAVDRAKAVNMPKDNIERAISRGAGDGEGAALENAVYECMGPGGVSMLIVALTDNTNRAYTNIKTTSNKNGGNMEAKVKWQFDQRAVVRVEDISKIEDRDSIELELIDAGAMDIDWHEVDGLIVTSEVQDFKKTSNAVEALELAISAAGLEYVPNITVELTDDQGARLMKFIDLLEEDDDVDAVFTNAE